MQYKHLQNDLGQKRGMYLHCSVLREVFSPARYFYILLRPLSVLQYSYSSWCLEWCWNTDCSHSVLVIDLDGSGQVISVLQTHTQETDFSFIYLQSGLNLSSHLTLTLYLVESLAYLCSFKDSDTRELCWAGARTMRVEVRTSSGTRSQWKGLSSNLTPMNSILGYYKVIYKDILCTNSKGDCECGMLAESENVEERALRTNVPTLDHVPQCGRW